MLYISQLSYPETPYITMTDTPEEEYGKTTTVKSSGCGLCAAVMVADRLLISPRFDIKDAVALSYESGASRSRGTDYALFAPAFAKKLGLKYEKTSSILKLEECLKYGGCAVAHIRAHKDGSKPYFSDYGHYVTVISVDKDGYFAVLDPSLRPGKYDTPERRLKVCVKDGICYCKKDVLFADTEWSTKEDRGFWLFSR